VREREREKERERERERERGKMCMCVRECVCKRHSQCDVLCASVCVRARESVHAHNKACVLKFQKKSAYRAAKSQRMP